MNSRQAVAVIGCDRLWCENVIDWVSFTTFHNISQLIVFFSWWCDVGRKGYLNLILQLQMIAAQMQVGRNAILAMQNDS